MNQYPPLLPHPRKLNRVSALFIVIIGMILFGWGYDVWEDRSHSLVLTEAVRIYDDYANPARRELGWITAANSVKVLRIRHYGGSHRAVLVRLKDGREGWILAEKGFELRRK